MKEISTDQYTCRTFKDVNSLSGYIVFALVGLVAG